LKTILIDFCPELMPTHDYQKERWIGIGILDGRIVDIVFTEPDEQTIYIISLRKALLYERKRYEQYLKDELGES
jgi:uncharacterized protein